MKTPRPTKWAEGIVFVLSVFGIIAMMIKAGYQYGKAESAKQCATVKGEQVVSSTADVCTYANAYGRATRTRKAL